MAPPSQSGCRKCHHLPKLLWPSLLETIPFDYSKCLIPGNPFHKDLFWESMLYFTERENDHFAPLFVNLEEVQLAELWGDTLNIRDPGDRLLQGWGWTPFLPNWLRSSRSSSQLAEVQNRTRPLYRVECVRYRLLICKLQFVYLPEVSI